MRRDINDGLKSFAIIALFIAIIGLIIISTHPEKFAEMIFFWRSNNVREGNTNIDAIPSECQQCVISPTIGPAFGISNIDANIIQHEQVDPSNVLPRKGGAENLYITSTDMSYVFCSWSTDTNKSMTSEWLDKCSQYMYSGDISCCHGSTGDFYDGNYIIDTLHNEKYMGLVFKYDISSSSLVKSGIGDQMIASNLYNFTPVVLATSNDMSFNNGRFKYFTSITSDSMAISLKIGERVEDNSVVVDNLINCQGVRVPPPVVTTPDWNNMPIDLNGLTGETAAIDNNGSSSNDTLKPSNFGDTTSTISAEVQSQLKSAVDSLVKQFETKINSMNIASASNINNTNNRVQYPNIGNPTYLNIGSCNNNSPYVYNSGCTSDATTAATRSGSGYLNQYQCYPSMTGEFQDCGPQGYNSLPQF